MENSKLRGTPTPQTLEQVAQRHRKCAKLYASAIVQELRNMAAAGHKVDALTLADVIAQHITDAKNEL